eukprot:SAG11_NODE_23302_length_391_cov_0.886986_1_plen_46_part_10
MCVGSYAYPGTYRKKSADFPRQPTGNANKKPNLPGQRAGSRAVSVV